jgi:hypothetical protein
MVYLHRACVSPMFDWELIPFNIVILHSFLILLGDHPITRSIGS